MIKSSNATAPFEKTKGKFLTDSVLTNQSKTSLIDLLYFLHLRPFGYMDAIILLAVCPHSHIICLAGL